MLLLDRGKQTIEVSQIGDIALNTRDILADRVYSGIQFSLATTRDEDMRFFGDKALLSSGKTDTAVTTSDRSDLSF